MKIKQVFGLLAVLSLLSCAAVPVLFFLGKISAGTFRAIFLAASCFWFLFAVLRNLSGK